MKYLSFLVLFLLTQSCSLLRSTDEKGIESIAEEVLKEKSDRGIDIQIKPIEKEK